MNNFTLLNIEHCNVAGGCRSKRVLGGGKIGPAGFPPDYERRLGEAVNSLDLDATSSRLQTSHFRLVPFYVMGIHLGTLKMP